MSGSGTELAQKLSIFSARPSSWCQESESKICDVNGEEGNQASNFVCDKVDNVMDFGRVKMSRRSLLHLEVDITRCLLFNLVSGVIQTKVGENELHSLLATSLELVSAKAAWWIRLRLCIYSKNVWFMLPVSNLLILVLSCDSTTKMAKSAIDPLQQLMNKTPTKHPAHEEMRLFSLQLLHNNSVITAYGLFNVDSTLLFTITGAATTYLVLLLQFGNDANATTEKCNITALTSTIVSILRNTTEH
ncbi:hypothetical protein B566_EDAN015521 [Ephemera danica]|nr:hypothetical protein B566_EDAN015521 [Ephemera danica]